MRDQYVGDVSDALKFAYLRALAGNDRRLGVAWYYVLGEDGKSDGRHVEWRQEPAWQQLDSVLHTGLSSLPERSIAELERAAIWPDKVIFHREPMPTRDGRLAWASRMGHELRDADLVFLDPDNGIGDDTKKHATMSELQMMRRPGRALVFISFPGRNLPHDQLVQRLHLRLTAETGAQNILTLRTNVSVPRLPGSKFKVQRQRWLTILDADGALIARAKDFARVLQAVPSVRAQLDHMHS